MSEYIERDLLISMCRRKVYGKIVDGGAICMLSADQIRKVPAADVVSKGAYDQCDWERVVALTQLKEIGKGLGERMDDVRPVKWGKWIVEKIEDPILEPIGVRESFRCSECDYGYVSFDQKRHNFCPNCGADMRSTNCTKTATADEEREVLNVQAWLKNGEDMGEEQT